MDISGFTQGASKILNIIIDKVIFFKNWGTPEIIMSILFIFFVIWIFMELKKIYSSTNKTKNHVAKHKNMRLTKFTHH